MKQCRGHYIRGCIWAGRGGRGVAANMYVSGLARQATLAKTCKGQRPREQGGRYACDGLGRTQTKALPTGNMNGRAGGGRREGRKLRK